MLSAPLNISKLPVGTHGGEGGILVLKEILKQFFAKYAIVLACRNLSLWLKMNLAGVFLWAQS